MKIKQYFCQGLHSNLVWGCLCDKKKKKNTVPWTVVMSDLNGEEIVRTFYEKKLQKTSQKEFRIEKVIKRKDDRL